MNPYQPMNAAALLDRVFDLYKQTFIYQLGFAVISMIAVSTLAMVLLFVLGFGIVFAAMGVLAESAATVVFFIVLAVIIVFAVVIGMYFTEAGYMCIARCAFYGERVRIPFREIFRAVPNVASVSAALILAIIPWLLAVGGIIFLGGFALALTYEVAPTWLLWGDTAMGFGIIMLVSLTIGLSLLIYTNIFALAIPVAIFERRHFFAALARSFHLMKGSFWRILGLRVLWFLIMYLFSQSFYGLWMMFLSFLSQTMDVAGVLYPIVLIFSTLGLYGVMTAAGLLAAPLPGIFAALLYFNRKIKKEGLDIEIRLKHLAWGRTP